MLLDNIKQNDIHTATSQPFKKAGEPSQCQHLRRVRERQCPSPLSAELSHRDRPRTRSRRTSNPTHRAGARKLGCFAKGVLLRGSVLRRVPSALSTRSPNQTKVLRGRDRDVSFSVSIKQGDSQLKTKKWKIENCQHLRRSPTRAFPTTSNFKYLYTGARALSFTDVVGAIAHARTRCGQERLPLCMFPAMAVNFAVNSQRSFAC